MIEIESLPSNFGAEILYPYSYLLEYLYSFTRHQFHSLPGCGKLQLGIQLFKSDNHLQLKKVSVKTNCLCHSGGPGFDSRSTVYLLGLFPLCL